MKRRTYLLLGLLTAIAAIRVDAQQRRPLPDSVWARVAPAEFPRAARDTGQLKAGAKVPPLMLYTQKDEPFDLNAALREKPTVLVFFRHTWETLNLAVVNSAVHALPGLKEMGYQVLGIYGWEPKYIVAGKPLQEMDIPFPILADKHQEVGRAFGLLFEEECEHHYRDRESPSHWSVRTTNNVEAIYGKAVYFVGRDEIVRYQYQYHTLGFTFGDITTPGGDWSYDWHFEIPQQLAVPATYMTPGQILSVADHYKDGRHAWPRELATALKSPESVTQLNLRDQGLTALPRDVLRLPNLEVLLLDGNSLSELPPEIGQLSKLRRLGLSNNALTALPAEIGRLTALQELALYGNRLKRLPPEIGKLTELERLVLCYNPLEELPPQIGNLKKVTKLRLFHHRMTELPEEIGGMDSLIVLAACGIRRDDGSFAGLKELPESLGHLGNLTVLSLWGNELTALPESMGRLRKLAFLNVGENRIASLPDSLCDVVIKRALMVHNNALTELPADIGRCEVRAWLDVSGNRLTRLPDSFCKVRAWRVNLSHNQLTSLPEAIWTIEKAGHMDLSHNQLTQLPRGLTSVNLLTSLNLSHNRFTALPDECFERLERKRYRLWCKGNPFSAEEGKRVLASFPKAFQEPH